MTEGRLIAGQAAGMLLAFGVGLLIGARACGEAPEVREPVIETVVEERVVFRCLPDAGATAEVDAGTGPAEPAKPARVSVDDEAGSALPDAPPPQTPAERRKLLAWVQRQSSTLSLCSPPGKKTIRTSVTLELDSEGKVKRARIVDSSDEIPADVERCLRRQMAQWLPPSDLVTGRDRLIFALIL